MCKLLDFTSVKFQYNKVKYYWRMTNCSAFELKNKFKISITMAERWIERLAAEKKEEANAKRK